MPADRVFRRSHTVVHSTARSLRHQSQGVSPKWVRVALVVGVVGVVGLLIGTALTVFVPHRYLQFPTIRQFDCKTGDGTPCPDEIQQSLQPLLGESLLFNAVNEKLTALVTPTGVQVVAYVRVLPDTLQLTVTPLDVLFYVEQQGETMAITRSGAKLAVPSTYNPELLVIHSEDVLLGQQLSSTSQAPGWLLQLVNELTIFFESTGTKPTKLTLRSPFALQIELLDETRPILLNPQESALNVARLSSILKSDQYTEIATPGATLDVRFRLPVLRR